MKFRARTSNDNLLLIYGVINQIEKNSIGDKLAVYLTEDCIRLSVINNDIDNTRCYSELAVPAIFSEYIIESKADNAILFEIGLNNLFKALQSGRNAVQCQFKLTKQNERPYLSFESRSLDAMALNVTHDIPIRMIPATEIINYMPPNVPSPEVALEISRTKLLKTMVDKMGKYSKHITVTAMQRGQLTLQVDHSSAVITTHYSNLTPRFEGTLTESSRGNKAQVKVDRKKLSNVLNYASLAKTGIFLFVTDNNTMVLHVTLSPHAAGTITYYVPVIMMDLDDR